MRECSGNASHSRAWVHGLEFSLPTLARHLQLLLEQVLLRSLDQICCCSDRAAHRRETRAAQESCAGTTETMGRGACRHEWMGWSWGWAGLQRTDVSEALTAKSAVKRIASAGRIWLYFFFSGVKSASVWPGVMPQSEMLFSLAMLTSIVADSVSSWLYRMSVTVSVALTAMAGANADAPSEPS